MASRIPPLTTEQLNLLALVDPILNQHFLGTFAIDKIPPPRLVKAKTGMIINYDSHKSPGSHWVAIWVKSDGNVEFFDSFGLPPIKTSLKQYLYSISNNITYNQNKLQSFSANTCGLWCVLFLISRVRNVSLQSFVSAFEQESEQNDETLLQLIKKIYK